MIASLTRNRAIALLLIAVSVLEILPAQTLSAFPATAAYVYIPVSSAKASIQSMALSEGIKQYENALFSNAVVCLRRAIAEGLSNEELLMAWECLAYCYVALNDQALARSAFRKLLSLDPTFRPGRDASPKVVAIFEEVLLKATAEGTVLSEGLPLADATVLCVRARRARTDERGRFKLVGVPLGEAVLLAYKEGYAAASRVVKTVEGRREPVEIQLSPGQTSALRGKVVDEKGKPTPDLRVLLKPTAPGGPELVLETNQDGNYGCPYIATGDYLLTVAARAYETSMLRVSLRRGETVSQDLRLQLVKPPIPKKKRGMAGAAGVLLGLGLLALLAGGKGGGTPTPQATVSGNVLDSLTLQPLSGMRVQIGAASTASGPDGIYSVRVPEGTHSISLTDPTGNYQFDPEQPNTIQVVANQDISRDIYMRPSEIGPPPPPP